MKFIVISFLIIVFFNVNAATTDRETSKTCLRQAISLVNRLKSEILADLDEAQSNEILRLATENCNKYFNDGALNPANAGKAAEKADITASDKEGEPDDWLTEHILKGEAADKEGNQRLKRLQHK